MLTVTINDPAYDPGTAIGVNGLGAFENGVPREITPEEEERFLSQTGKSIQELDGGVFSVSGSGTVFKDSSTPPVEPVKEDEPGFYNNEGSDE